MMKCASCQIECEQNIFKLCLSCRQKIEEIVMSPRETDYAAKILHELRAKHGAVCFSIAGNVYQGAGWPDSFIAHEKFIGFVEFKGRETKLQKLQAHTLKLLKKKGVKCYVVRFMESNPNVWDITDENEILQATVSSLRFNEGVEKLLNVLADLTSSTP